MTAVALLVLMLAGAITLAAVALIRARRNRRAQFKSDTTPNLDPSLDVVRVPAKPTPLSLAPARPSKGVSSHNAKIVIRSQAPTPERIYKIARKLSRSEAFRMVRRMDPEREHASFAYNPKTGVARSIAVADAQAVADPKRAS